jgi:hypothetical protein
MPTNGIDPREVAIAVGSAPELRGLLRMPIAAAGVVVWLRPPNASEGQAREDALVDCLSNAGLASLLLSGVDDGASPDGGTTDAAHPRRRVDSMAARLVAVTEWLLQDPDTQPLNIGYIASNAAAAAALIAAARAPDYIDAVVAFDGQIDLAGEDLDKVRAPTLLFTNADRARDELRAPFDRLRTEKHLEVLPRSATDAGCNEMTCRWFTRHLLSRSHSIPP